MLLKSYNVHYIWMAYGAKNLTTVSKKKKKYNIGAKNDRILKTTFF